LRVEVRRVAVKVSVKASFAVALFMSRAGLRSSLPFGVSGPIRWRISPTLFAR
jgi:hypothetical protein